jgi:hypothetical protein
MSGGRSATVQRAIDFLLALAATEGEVSPLPATLDYGAIVRLAAARGVATDEASVQAAFATIMRARLLSNRQAVPDSGPPRSPRD